MRLDGEMAALDRQHQVAGGGDVGGHDMHVDAEFARQHAARLADAAHVVERIADRQRMQHHPAARAPNAGCRPRARGRCRRRSTVEPATLTDAAKQLAREPPGGDRDARPIRAARPADALGEIDGMADRLLGLGEIDHGARLHAARFGVADAEDLDRRGCAGAAPPAAPAA